MLQGYLKSCDCGHELAIKAAEAGREVRCPHCRAKHLAPRLSELRRWPNLVGPIAEHTELQFGPLALFVFTAIAAGLLASVLQFGWVLTGSVTMVITAWLVGAAMIQRTFVQASVIVAVLAMFAALTVTSLHQHRGEARESQCRENLRQLSGAYQVANDYRTFSRGNAFPPANND